MTYNYSGMSKFSNVLVTGGAGYIGSVLTRKLVLSKYNVKVLDSLIFGPDGISDLVSNNSVKLFVSDIRNKKITRSNGIKLVKKFDRTKITKYFYKEFIDFIEISEKRFFKVLKKYTNLKIQFYIKKIK